MALKISKSNSFMIVVTTNIIVLHESRSKCNQVTRAKASGGHEPEKFPFGIFLVFSAIETSLILPEPGFGKSGKMFQFKAPAIIQFCFLCLLT